METQSWDRCAAIVLAACIVRLYISGLAASLPVAAGDGTWLRPERIDPRRASVERLALLPGIGPKTAALIAERLRSLPVRDALRAIPGVSPAVVTILRRYVGAPNEAGDRPASGR